MSTFFLFSTVLFSAAIVFFLFAIVGHFTQNASKPIYMFPMLASIIGFSISLQCFQRGDFLSPTETGEIIRKAEMLGDTLYREVFVSREIMSSLEYAQGIVLSCISLVMFFSLLFVIARSLQLKAQD